MIEVFVVSVKLFFSSVYDTLENAILFSSLLKFMFLCPIKLAFLSQIMTSNWMKLCMETTEKVVWKFALYGFIFFGFVSVKKFSSFRLHALEVSLPARA